MYRKIVFLALAAVVLFTATPDAEAKKGFYLGLGAVYNTIEGDFSGSAGLEGGTEVIILPALDEAFGFDIRTGYGITDQWAVELNLMSSGHDGTWQGLTGKASYTSFSINCKYSLPGSDRVKPYLQFGISGNTLIIKKGASVISTGETADATLSGPGVNLGGGFDVYLNPRVSLNPGIMYRYVDYTDASGVHRSGTINERIDGSGISLVLTTAYHF